MKVVRYKNKIINCACIRSVEVLMNKEVKITDLNGDFFFFYCDNKEEAFNLLAIIFDEMKGE